MPTARGGVATGVVGRKIYTFGGEENTAIESGVFNEIEAYDTVADRWESVGTMKIPRHGTFAIGVNGRIYIPGGGINRAADRSQTLTFLFHSRMRCMEDLLQMSR